MDQRAPGTTVFNLQVFRVLKARSAGKATPSVKKIYSVFPSKRRYRMPKVKILPGTCYVWRIWPFVSGRFTAERSASATLHREQEALAAGGAGRRQAAGGEPPVTKPRPLIAGVLTVRKSNDPPNGRGGAGANRRIFHA